jgi:hypothetical protein
MSPKIITRTRSEELNYVAGLTRRQPERAREATEAFSEDVNVVRTALEAWGSVDLAEVTEQLGNLVEALDALAQQGIEVDGLETLKGAAEDLNMAAGELSLDEDVFMTFTEGYDELESALDEYDSLRESDRYEGKSDDMEQAWGSVTEKMNILAEAADTIGFDATPVENPAEPAQEPSGDPE